MPKTGTPKAPKASKAPKTTLAARKPRTPRAKKTSTSGQNGTATDVAAPALNPFTPQHYVSTSRALTAASISRDRAPLRSVEVPGLGPAGGPGVAFYRPYSTADFLRLVELADRAREDNVSQAEQIRLLIDNLYGRWCDPTGRIYTREEILAVEPVNLALVSTAILYAKELAVDDHESLLAELGVPLDPDSAAASRAAETSLSPNASRGARSSAASIVSR